MASIILVIAHGSRERWGTTPLVMLLASFSLILLISDLFSKASVVAYALMVPLQVGLLISLALEDEYRWRTRVFTLCGLMLGGMAFYHLFPVAAALDPLAAPPALINARMLFQLGLLVLSALTAWWTCHQVFSTRQFTGLTLVLVQMFLLDVLAFGLLGEPLKPTVLIFGVQIVLVGALAAVYINRSRRSMPALPKNHAYDSLLDTVEVLAQRSEAEMWPRLLESAVAVVPGAEAGSIRLRQEREFVFVAQQGFGENIIGLRTAENENIAWYGDFEQWKQGQPRIFNRAELTRVMMSNGNRRVAKQLSFLSEQSSTNRIGCNLCIPIVLHGDVVAEINLDAFRDRAFDERSVEVARQYALQITALLASLRERDELQARVREFEVIESLSGALRGLKGMEGATKRLVQETSRLMHSENAALLLIQPDGHTMRCSAAAGFFSELKHDLIPRGRGVGWDALESRAPIWRNDIFFDSRAIGTVTQELVPYSQIAVPMINSKSEALGVLISARNNAQAYTERDVRVLEVIANIAASTLERVRIGEALEAEFREKHTLLELSQLLENNDFTQLPVALEKIRQLGHADYIELALREGDEFRGKVQVGQLSETLREVLGDRLHVNNPVLKRIAGGQSFQVADTDQDASSALLARHGLRSLYMVGVPGDTNMQGILVLLRLQHTGGWNETETRMLEGSARILGALLGRLERSHQLEAAYEGALRTIGLALEARDRETGGHTDRVARMAEQIGVALGFSETELRDLRWGAYLHDVGKLAIPDSILLKPGKLTPEEFTQMKTHATLGDELVRNLPFVPLAARQIVRHHHERMDGRGYPDGKVGMDIPLSARIFAICDVFDALRSERPYKKAMPSEEAAQEIWRSAQAGHLDPRLVEVFLKTQNLRTGQMARVAS